MFTLKYGILVYRTSTTIFVKPRKRTAFRPSLSLSMQYARSNFAITIIPQEIAAGRQIFCAFAAKNLAAYYFAPLSRARVLKFSRADADPRKKSRPGRKNSLN